MPDTIRILAKRAFRFQRPETDPSTALKENPNATLDDVYFVATPNEVVDAPAWIQKDPLFKQIMDLDLCMVVQQSAHTGATGTPPPHPGHPAPSEQASETGKKK